ncbi:MAG: hypothetical protein M3Y59_11775 [Myxococcota bacterium]|nr:hypothetical protein [Myxococcota bacterium]
MGAASALILWACGGLVELGPHSQEIGPDGGTLRLEPSGVTLVIPPGSLTQTVVVSLGTVPAPVAGLERAIAVRPEAVQFISSAQLRYDLQAQTPERWKLLAVRADGGTAPMGSRRQWDAGFYFASLDQAGTFALAASNEVCDDQQDNDDDGRIDCLDPACENDLACQQCEEASAACGSGSHCCPLTLSCSPNGCDDCCVAAPDGGHDEDAGTGDGGSDGGSPDGGG